MLWILVISLCIGLIFLLSSIINLKSIIKPNFNKKISKNNKKNKFFKLIFENKLLSLLVEEISTKNSKKIDKIRIIYNCKRSEKLYKLNPITKEKELKKQEEIVDLETSKNLSIISLKRKQESLFKSYIKKIYLIKILIIVLALIFLTIGKIGLKQLVVQHDLSPQVISQQTQNKVSTSDADSIVKYIGNDYKKYVKNNNLNALALKIWTYSNSNNIDIDKNDVVSISSIYNNTYLNGEITFLDICQIIILAIASSFFIDIYIEIRYRVCNMRLMKEFQTIELMALLQMNRKELNIYEILKEINKYTLYLRTQITRCLNRYNTSPIVALDKLILEVDNSDFTNFITILKSCLDKSKDINSDILKLQRKLRILNDTLEDDKRLEFKKLCLTISQLPLIAIAVLNLLIPVLSQINIENVFTM